MTTGLSLGNTLQLIFAVLLLILGVIVAIQGIKKLTEKKEAQADKVEETTILEQAEQLIKSKRQDLHADLKCLA